MDIDAVTPVADETAAVGMSEQSDTINAADLYTPEANGADAQTGAQQTDATVSDTNVRMYTSDEMSAAVQKRLKQERKGAAYQLGREILDEFMRQGNLSEADALKMIREQRIKSKAAMFKENPEAAFEELLRAREQRVEPEEPEEAPKSGGDAETAFRELVVEINDGRVPKEFDIRSYMKDPDRAREFLELREALGVEKACEIAMRMTSASKQTKAEVNRSLPKSIGTNNSYSPKKLDFMEMSDKDFREMEQKFKKMSASGKRVEF